MDIIKRFFRKKHKRFLIVTVALRQIVPSMVIPEKEVLYTNVEQQPVTRKKYIMAWLKESLKNKGIMTMPNLLETKFMLTVLFFLVMYGKWKIEEM